MRIALLMLTAAAFICSAADKVSDVGTHITQESVAATLQALPAGKGTEQILSMVNVGRMDVGIAVMRRVPGKQGIFGEPVSSRVMIEKIGLDGDSNTNLSRRMLFLLESTDATNPELADTTRDQLLGRYLDESVKDYRPPRFLLNDVIRYWRTMCVDFAGKEYEGPEKWGLRNVKLRTARKVLFAGGLLPVFECARLTAEQMPEYLREQLRMPPVDRIAEAFLRHRAADPGGRALGAYDDFLALLDDEPSRAELEALTRSQAGGSEVFAEATRLGKELEHGLLAMLFETDSLPKLVREFGIF